MGFEVGGRHEKNMAFKGRVSDGFCENANSLPECQKHSESSDFSVEACPQTPSLLSLVLICRQSTYNIATGTACDTTPTYEDITAPATRNIAGLLNRRQASKVELESTLQA